MAIYFPVADQKDGSYLTITSDSGIQFMFIFFLSGLSQMLVHGFSLLSPAMARSVPGSGSRYHFFPCGHSCLLDHMAASPCLPLYIRVFFKCVCTRARERSVKTGES